MENCKYLATYIVCDSNEKLNAYEVYKKGNGCFFSKTETSNVYALLKGKSNIIELLKMGSILQIYTNDFGINMQIGTLQEEAYTNIPIFNKLGEIEGDNIYKVIERLDNKMGDMVYSNKSNYQKVYGGLYGKRFNFGSFSSRNG